MQTSSLRTALLAAALFSAPLAVQAQPAQNRFQIVNRTGQEASAVHAVHSGRKDWGGNLAPGPMPTDKALTLRPDADTGCRFDVRLVLRDGREAVKRGQDICATPRVVLEPGDVRGVAQSRPTQPAPGQPNPKARSVSSGTGFVVAADRVLTNQHVVAGCDRVFIRTADGRMLPAVPPAKVDAALDLSLLTVPGNPGPALAFRAGPAVRRGEGVVAYGFPLPGLLSSDPKLTRGEVNGLNGLGDNPSQYQISAPVQPGNSGGPLLDLQGNIVGVVVSKLNAGAVSRRTGDIAQNINFAVKGTAAADFLRRAGLTPQAAESRGPERSAADVGEIANRSTVFIRCER
ncbi:trypsin-like peptidase domain-containing protein [Roseomonas marmotae]|uniref:Serine protease n=1 Tax=Roseomonas marmotae TaxID=2768161 RepID=A0ABS3KEG8_9PROT|nr:trypsin-like peptidase domain-containing protein [Roseomonas marmotae]MBO1075835.1 trypsin-like peptidase domain-containing protein [Roseomonas marmotae]QTI81972.1 trypsin-like peptidase domain-containing protein [Roseomonas marmotae]